MNSSIASATNVADNRVDSPEHAAAPTTDLQSAYFDSILNACSEHVWREPNLRPMQSKIIKLIFDPSEPNAILAVYRTGEGKSHVIRMIGALENGVCLVFIPLLTLSADVMAKFQDACQDYGSNRAFHLDEIYDNNRENYNEILEWCSRLTPTTTSTIFAFVSPQHLCISRRACNVFIQCALKKTLRSVVLDEVHLLVGHALSFRDQCRELSDIFFKPVFHPENPDQFIPRILCLTATFPTTYYDGLERLTTISFRRHPSSIQRGSVDEFLQRNITMKQVVVGKGDYVKIGLANVIVHLQQDKECKIVVFCNSRQKSFHYASELERKLDEVDVTDVDVLVINGGLNKHEKFWRIRFFCGSDDEFVEGSRFRALVSTNAANVGIDSSSINMVARFELPRDLMTFFQERGRGGRKGAPSTSIIYYNSSSYANIMSQILSYNNRPDQANPTEDELAVRGVNSAITPLANSARQLEQQRSNNSTAVPQYALTKSMKRALKKQQQQDLGDVMKFLCLNRGCQQYRSAFYMSEGKLDGVNVVDSCREIDPCGCCPICDGSWGKMHLPIFRSELVRFFESSTGRRTFPMEYDTNKPITLMLSDRSYWKECIFDRASSGVLVRNIDALIMSLIAADILTMEKDRKGKFVWSVVWVDNTTPRYMLDDAWDGVNLIPEGTPRRRAVPSRENEERENNN